MKLKRLNLVNYKNIEYLSEEFSGESNLYFIRGDNEVGKTSVIQAILTALNGTKNAGELLQRGKEKGEVSVTIDKYEITIRFTQKQPNGYLRIKDTETGMSSNKVSFLSELFHHTHIDPIKFAQLAETAEGRRKQVEIVKNLLPQETIDAINDIDKKISETKDEYREENAKLKELPEQEIPENAPEKIDYDKELQEHYKAKNINDEQERLTQEIPEIQTQLEKYDTYVNEITFKHDKKITEKDREIQELKKLIEQKENQKRTIENEKSQELNDLDKNHKKLKSDLEAKMNRANEIANYSNGFLEKGTEDYMKTVKNKLQEYENYQIKLRNQEKRKNKLAKLKDLKGKGEQLKADKQKIIRESQLPVEGLTFDNECLYLNGIRVGVDQTSTSQNMELAVRLAIQSNDKAKIFLLSQGESIGKKKLQEIKNIAEKYGFQGFIEFRDDQDNLSIEQYTEK